MRFNVVFDTDNAAFDGNYASEVGRILYDIANKMIEQDLLSGTVKDINGNRIGYFGEV